MSIRKVGRDSFELRWFPGGKTTRVRPDGTTEAIWQRQRTLHGVTFREATNELKKLEGREAGRRASADHRITFRTLAALYIEKLNMAESSRERHRGILDRLVLPMLGDRTVESLEPLDVEKYQRQRLTAGISARTVNREVTVIRAVLYFGLQVKRITETPLPPKSVAPIIPEEDDEEELHFFDRDEWARFIAAFDDDAAWARHVGKVRRLGPVKIGAAAPDARRYGGGRRTDSAATAAYRERLRGTVPIFRALLFTGGRLDDVLGLKKKRALAEAGFVTFQPKKTRRRENAKPVRIPLSAALRKLISDLPQRVSEYLFARPDGGRYSKREVQRAFDVAKKVGGIRKELTCHSLRHTFASWHAMAGTPLHTISRLLGHADVRMTERYAHLSPDHLREAAGVIEAVEKQGFEASPMGRSVGHAG